LLPFVYRCVGCRHHLGKDWDLIRRQRLTGFFYDLFHAGCRVSRDKTQAGNLGERLSHTGTTLKGEIISWTDTLSTNDNLHPVAHKSFTTA
jgi:hypothetical protein